MSTYLIQYLSICLVVILFPFVVASCAKSTPDKGCVPFQIGTGQTLEGETYILQVEEQGCPRIKTIR